MRQSRGRVHGVPSKIIAEDRAEAAQRPLNLYTATACELQDLLSTNVYTSEDLVTLYLDQIERHNHDGMKLHAIISTAPRATVMEEARKLDKERKEGNLRSRAHGIPIIVSDNALTGSHGIPTTWGTLALTGLENRNDATCVFRLRRAGCIIIAKANLSELDNLKGTNIKSGWSAVGGQTQSPYVRGGVKAHDRWLGHSTPGGSSSGSAVGVAAGFAPWSVGSETDGTLVFPAIRAALYSFRSHASTQELCNAPGSQDSFYSFGCMAKSVADVAVLTQILNLYPLPCEPQQSESWNIWKNMKVAYLCPKNWRFPEDHCELRSDFFRQADAAMRRAIDKIELLGASVVRGARLATPDSIFEALGWKDYSHLTLHQARRDLQSYFGDFHSQDPNIRTVKTLEDLIKFNEEHSEKELPLENSNQDLLHAAAASTLTREQFIGDLCVFENKVYEAVDAFFQWTDVDIIVAPGGSKLTTMAMAAGCTIASVPLGFSDFNGRPFGLLMMTRANNEGDNLLLKAMAAWEKTFPKARMPPPMMLEMDKMLS